MSTVTITVTLTEDMAFKLHQQCVRAGFPMGVTIDDILKKGFRIANHINEGGEFFVKQNGQFLKVYF